VILVVSFFVYSSALNHEFIKWDDDKQITDNPYVKTINGQNAVYNLLFERFTFIPLTIYSLVYSIHGADPFPFHLMNILFHLLNIVLVYFLAKKIVQSIPAALFIAMLFALHPMRVESVAWISELKDLLFTFFTLISYLVYIKYLQKDRKMIFLIPAFLFMVLASFSKIQGLLIAPTLLLFDIYYDRKISFSAVLEKIVMFVVLIFIFRLSFWQIFVPFLFLVFIYKKWIVNKIRIPKKIVTSGIFTLCIGVVLFVIYFVNNNTIDFWTGEPDKRNVFSLFERMFLAGYALFFYLAGFVFPFNLNAVHPYPQRLVSGALSAEYYFSSLVLMVVLILSVYLIMKRKSIPKILFFGWFFFIVNISMVLHFIPIEGRLVAADRYSYLAYLGLFVITGYFLQRFVLQNQKIKSLFIYVFSALTLLFSITTYSRTTVWKSTLTLFEDVLRKNPNIPFAYLNLGGIYLNNRLPENALVYFNKSIKLDSLDPSAYFNRALAYYFSGNSDSALNDFNKVIVLSKAKSDIALVYTNMGEIYHKSGKDSLALFYYKKSLETDSSIAASHNNIGMFYFKANDLKKASDCFNRAVELDPDYADAWNNKGWVLVMQGELPEAMKCLDRSLLLNPDYAMAYNNRGYLKFKAKDLKGSMVDYNKALKLDSTLVEAYLNRGWVYSSTGDFKSAIEDYSYVLKKIRNHQTALTNRAFAWFYMKNYENASVDFEDLVKYFPAVAVNHQNLAWFNLQMKEYDKAISEFTIAINADSSLTGSYLNLGWIWIEKGEFAKAEANLNKAIQLTPANGEALFLLGELNRKKKKNSVACNFYSEAIKYGNKQAQKALTDYCKN
jgi:tetratricopeptide (TPR) repeat protein